MPAAFMYILKLSVSLGIVFLFYQLVLRRLTFYNWNRWYLLGYSLLSFIIPFIDITPALHENRLTDSSMIQWVPVLYKQPTGGIHFSFWNIVSLIIITGMGVMLVRLLVQLISFNRMRKKAKLISAAEVNLYQVDASIIPFSFGKSVFFNTQLHSTEELEKIICHEFVHVKQRHSIDILFSELLCLLNWYNPFAWMLKAAIRQNLEFVADNQVLEHGINKKQYQYLLLKVIGNDQFSIAQKFNFSSLKKRIAMMNKNKSAQLHLLRFLFLLPVLAVILLSFRKEMRDTFNTTQKQVPPISTAVTDTVPELTKPNNKGYVINVKDQKGDCLLVIKDKAGKEVKRLLLTEWNANAEKYEAMYGKIVPPPPPPPPVVAATAPDAPDALEPAGFPAPPPPPPVPAKAIKITPAKGAATKVDGAYLKAVSIDVDPLIVFNGDIISESAMQAIDPETIHSVQILKGDNAIAAYGNKAQDGVIIITSKSFNAASEEGIHFTAKELQTSGAENNGVTTIRGADVRINNPKGLVMLDGIEVPAGTKSLRGSFYVFSLNKEQAMKKYGEKGKNGATEVTTIK